MSSPRGHVLIDLGEGMTAAEMRPTFATYAAIEERLGPITVAIEKLEGLSVVALATVVWAAVTEGTGHTAAGPLTREQVGDRLLQLPGGIVEPSVKAIAFLSGALRGLARVASKGDQSSDDTKRGSGHPLG